MNFVLPATLSLAISRRIIPAICLLGLSAGLTGCEPENGDRILPYVHSASLGGGGQLVTQPLIDSRHRTRATHFNPSHRHTSHL
jgi:hypothetical protein